MKEKNTILQWIDERLPVITFVRKHLIDYPTPKNLNIMWNFGSLAGIMLVIMILSGWFLATHYVADTEKAFASVQHIMRDVNYGWLIRYIHMNGSSFFFILLYLHLLRGLYYGSYKKPRELLWIIGVVLLILVMVTAFVGYVLPWGQMSYWGATVITNLFSAIPWIGEDIVILILGGFSVDQPTLTRFFAIHFLIPFVIVGLTMIHLMALHVSKSNNPLGVEVKTKDDTVPFHPYYTGKDVLGLAVFLLIFAVVVFFFPQFFSEPENSIPANPLVTPEHIVPEWYFLPYYAMLRAIPDKLLGVIVMFGSVFILFFVPWLDRHPIRSALFRPLYRQFFFIFVAVVFILGWCGSNPPQGVYVVIARWATVYYFAFFLVIMPLLSRFEKGRSPPESIHAAERMKL
ncbi:MAG: cytochrome b N-terminal domain-containing protein [Alphaproteobacteria bacterium GM202ARS2]|nr:cytochrome b N-terminal domain-containing protein [Alphaproteobacteria bacterium GM202ARS2]